MRNKKKTWNVNDICLYILLFFGLFDAARNYTYLPVWFGYLKDIAIYWLFVGNLGRISSIKVPALSLSGFYLWMVSVILFTPLGFIYSEYDMSAILIACFKNIEFFLLILIFFQWEKIFSISFNCFIEKYVYGSILLCIVNIVGYWIPNPIVYRGITNGRLAVGFYGGRMTVGQPAIAIFPVLFSFFYLLFFQKNKRDFLLMITYGICFIFALSMSGLVIFIIGVALFILGYKSRKNSMKHKFLFVFSAIIVVFVIKKLIYSNEFVNQMVNTIENRLVGYVIKGSDASMNSRALHQKEALDTLKGMQWLCGRGEYGYVTNMTSKYIENTYIRTLITNGIIGLSSMLLFFAELIIKSIKYMRYNRNASLYMLLNIGLFLVHFYTLDFFLGYMLVFSFALFLTWMFRNIEMLS